MQEKTQIKLKSPVIPLLLFSICSFFTLVLHIHTHTVNRYYFDADFSPGIL